MHTQDSKEKVAFKGKQLAKPIIKIHNFSLAIWGKFVKIATIRDETWITETVTDPQSIINILKVSKPKADIFSFSQRPPDLQPKFDFYYELDNIAAIPIISFDNWWNNVLNSNFRKLTRRAEKNGVEFKIVPFDDNLVNGIMEIYNEAPIRQGGKFWHYGKPFETVKRENATYSDCSDFICAYLNNELIGFIKLVYVDKRAIIMQIIAKVKYRTKYTSNGMIAKAVEICAQKNMSYFIYGNFIYGKKGADTLTEFKERMGFQKIDIPKYFIPLTFKGKLAIKLGFHHFPYNIIPKWLLMIMLNGRVKIMEMMHGKS
jgi:hypothetical protein